MNDPRRVQRVIAVGASAGGVEALIALVGGLPADLAAPVFIAVHAPPYTHSSLPEILTRAGQLPAAHALHGELIEAGRIYVAPPDNHLIVRKGELEVVRGPRVNGHRPAVDVLFRSAAAAYGAGVIGVVLSGLLDCGSAGLRAIKARGGVAIVQDPSDAIFSEMPSNALRATDPDLVLPAARIGSAITAQLAIAHRERPDLPHEPAPPGRSPSFVTCPACHGSMTEAWDEDYAEYSCHVGHVFSLNGLVAHQAEELEAALWAAIRSFTETEALARRVASRTEGEVAERFSEKADVMKRNAMLLEGLIKAGEAPTTSEAQRLGAPTSR